MLYLHEGGIDAIAKDLLIGLSKALSNNFKEDLYLGATSKEIKTLDKNTQHTKEEVVVNKENSEESISTDAHVSQPKKSKQLSIFDQHDSELPPNSKNPKSIAKAKLNRTQTSKKPSPALIQGNLFATAQDQRL